jgi:hypothetical protein
MLKLHRSLIIALAPCGSAAEQAKQGVPVQHTVLQ